MVTTDNLRGTENKGFSMLHRYSSQSMAKVGPTSNKLQQKLFMLNWTPKTVFFNITKVLGNPSGGRLSFLDLKVKVALSRSDHGLLRAWNTEGDSLTVVFVTQTSMKCE